MPRLLTYESPLDKLTPSERGTEAQTMRGRRTAGFYNQAASEISGAAKAEASAAGDMSRAVADVGEGITMAAKGVEVYLDKRAISLGAAEGEQMFANLKTAWNDTVKESATRDPNDPTVAAKFREEVLEPQLDKFKGAYSSTPGAAQWADSYTQRVRHHMFETTAADMSTLAGMAAAKNIATLKNTASNTAHVSGDFHTAGFLLSNVDAQVSAIIDASPNLKGTKAEELRTKLTLDLRESIVKAGAIGAIAKSPDPEKTADEWTKRFPDLIDGKDAKQLAMNARQQLRAARQDQRWEEHNQKVIKQEASETRRDQLLQDIYSDDPKRIAKVNSRTIVNDPVLTPAAKEHMIRLVDREMKPESDARVSAATSRDLFARIYLPDGDPNKITDTNEIIRARVDGKLTKADFNDLRTEIVNARTPEGDRLGKGVDELVKAVKPSIDKSNPLMGKMDPDGGLNLYRFENDLRKKAAEYRQAGKNPHDLLDPSKPDFFGKPDNLTRYQKTMAESMADTSRRLMGKPTPRGNMTDPGVIETGRSVTNAPPAPIQPRKPGESPDAWLKRNGIK